MKVLITGAAGQVGRALLRSVPTGVEAVGVTRSQLDIANEATTLEQVRRYGPAVIINAAAYTAVDRAEDELTLARAGNADGPKHLALAARESGARLIHISTDFVFDGQSSAPYKVDAPTNPLNVYGLTKLEGEQAVLRTLSGQAVVLRTAWVYGAEGGNFVKTMLRLMSEKKALRVVADQIGTPTHAASLANAIWSLVAREHITGVHHFTDAGVASWYDFAVAIAEEAYAAGSLSEIAPVTPISSSDFPTRARRPSFSVLDKTVSLAAMDIAPDHWRRQLRTMLRSGGHV